MERNKNNVYSKICEQLKQLEVMHELKPLWPEYLCGI